MTSATKPDPADFSVNQRSGEYHVKVRVSGEVYLTINAASEEEAWQKAEKECFAPNYTPDLDLVDEVEIDSVREAQPMYRVMREGRPMQVSRLEPGDEPREPNDIGF